MDLARLLQENECLLLIATEMRESLDRDSALIESSDDSICLVDPQSRCLFVLDKDNYMADDNIL